MPAGAVNVDRRSKFGNPYRLSDYQFAHANGTPAPFDEAVAREMAIRDFRAWLEVTSAGQQMATLARYELRGKDLACWCSLDQPCHADVLLEIANG